MAASAILFSFDFLEARRSYPLCCQDCQLKINDSEIIISTYLSI